MARRIQHTSLPKEVPELEGWQISPSTSQLGRWEVTSTTSTSSLRVDWDWSWETQRERVCLLPWSCPPPAACFRQLTASGSSSSLPGEVLSRVNETLLSRIPSNMFVTCFYAILEPESGSLTYANAGHDLPYLHRNGEAEELRARGMPLGLMPGMGYEEKETILEAGEASSSTATAW